ncbi:homocitrate synthase lys21 [Neonectria magnoliae]|uniref:Homocitrate synthase lys21 n=1 Tax=Neonectria magnoliae TaxID=2732573 RepID=A0ABR1IBF4_9HYPO
MASELASGAVTSIGRVPDHTRLPDESVGGSVPILNRFKIVSLLREGEQLTSGCSDTETKIKIATALSDFGIEYIELTSPAASEQSRKDCEAICKLGLQSKILTRVRSSMEEAKLACDTGVAGVEVVVSTSTEEFSNGKDMADIKKTALEVIAYIKSRGVEAIFSTEEGFRDLVDLRDLYRTVDQAGVTRVRVADTLGCATPRQVHDLVSTLRGSVSCEIETHFHNDNMCAIANAHAALEAGATHIDTSVLGIGQRNGITALGAFLARMIVEDRDYVTSTYKLPQLQALEELVAEHAQISVPFNNPVTGFSAFSHKAGIHSKAVLKSPSTYEIIDPADFGVTRNVHFASRLTGWNAIKGRAEQLGLAMTDDQIKELTQKIKTMADTRQLSVDDADSIIRSYHLELQA